MIVLVLAAMIVKADLVVIYSQSFDNPGSANALFNSDQGEGSYRGNWRTYYGLTAHDGGNAGVGSTSSSNDPRMLSQFGFIYLGWFQNNVNNKPHFFYDMAPVFESAPVEYRDVANLRTLGFDFWRGSGTAAVNGRARPAVQIGSVWYVLGESIEGVQGTATDRGNAWVEIDIQTAGWRVLSFDPGQGLSIGETVQTLSAWNAQGALTSVGVMAENTGTQFSNSDGQWRFDNLTIAAVPEPAVLSLLVGMMFVTLIGRRMIGW